MHYHCLTSKRDIINQVNADEDSLGILSHSTPTSFQGRRITTITHDTPFHSSHSPFFISPLSTKPHNNPIIVFSLHSSVSFQFFSLQRKSRSITSLTLMQGRCPYPVLYDLCLQANSTLSRYRQIISDFSSSHIKFVDAEFPNSGVERLEDHFSSNAISGQVSRDSVFQGKLKDCFLMAACLQLSQMPDLIPSLFVNPDISSGCCCLRFTAFGRPYYVIVDTIVPFENGVPVYAHPGESTDSIWFCLLEKAYAKLMGGWDQISGNSPDSIANIFGFWTNTEKVAAVGNVVDFVAGLLKETPLVFAATPPGGNAVKHGLTERHGYAVIGVGGRGVQLMDPRLDCQPAGRVFTVSAAVFKSVFQSVGWAIPLGKEWTASEIEFDISGELDGRFFGGDGPYVGNLPQWEVTFPQRCPFRVVCVMASKSENSIGFCMCQNGGNKVSYKKLEDVEFKGAIQGSSYSMKGMITKVGSPYTLAISRKVRAVEPAHVYARIEAPCRFVVTPISEPPFDSLAHACAVWQFTPGGNDGVGKFAPQWHLECSGPARLYIRASKGSSRAQHSFFVGVPNTTGRFVRPGKFYHEVRLHPDSPFELDFVDIDAAWTYVIVGVTRVKDVKPSQCSFDLWSSSPISLEEARSPSADENVLVQAGRRSIQLSGKLPTPRTAPNGRGPQVPGDFSGIGVARLYKMMEDL
jgi:hypothetical protein